MGPAVENQIPDPEKLGWFARYDPRTSSGWQVCRRSSTRDRMLGAMTFSGARRMNATTYYRFVERRATPCTIR